MKRLIIDASMVLVLLITFFGQPFHVSANVNGQAAKSVNIYLFWGEGCPHCEKARPFLEAIAAGNPDIHLYQYEIYNSDSNLEMLMQVSKGFGFNATKVPTIFIGNQYWEGFSDDIQREIQESVDVCLMSGCDDQVSSILAGEQNQVSEKKSLFPLLILVILPILVAGFFVYKKRNPGKP
jgi:glutaredoxin